MLGYVDRLRLGKVQRVLALGGLHHVIEEHGDGDGADAAGDGADPACDLAGAIKDNISDGSDLTVWPLDAVDTNINYNCAGLDPVCGDQGWNTRGGDENICMAGEGREIWRPFITTYDGSLLAHEQDGDRLANDVSGTDNDGEATAEEACAAGEAGFIGDFAREPALRPDPFKHSHDSEGCAGGERGTAVNDVANIGGVDTLNVLIGGYQSLDAVGIYAVREGDVEHDSANGFIIT